VVLPPVPGGSPAAPGRQVNPGAPGLERNNDLPYGSSCLPILSRILAVSALKTGIARFVARRYTMA